MRTDCFSSPVYGGGVREADGGGGTGLAPSVACGDSSPASGGAKDPLDRARIVAAARQWLGTPYVHQASAKGAGADCLGLVIGLYTELLGRAPETPPPYTPDWNERRPCEEPLLSAARRHLVEIVSSPVYGGGVAAGDGGGQPPPPQSAARTAPPQAGEQNRFLPGRILIFRVVKTGPAKHCGVISAHDRFIHAYAGRCVIESWLSRWWIERIAGVFDFPGVNNEQW